MSDEKRDDPTAGAVAREVLAAATGATPRPWGFFDGNNEHLITGPIVGDVFNYIGDDEEDCRFIVVACNAAEVLARRVLELEAAVQAAVAEEREACALEAENRGWGDADETAARIRARGER